MTNDDGPPSQQSSPYVHAFVQTLQKAGHLVSVILPHQQRSWIGKAHFVGQLTRPTYFRPGTLHEDDGITSDKPAKPNENIEEWVLIDGTPASCTQLGIYHFFRDRGPVDLVISGPNYGRNSTSLFSLSSGTIGGGMEAAVCAKKAIALSFAFYSRDHDPQIIAAASRVALKVIEHLYLNWSPEADLYSINVPLVPGVETHKIMYTYALQNYWTSGSAFEEVPATEGDQDPESHEQEIRQTGEAVDGDFKDQSTRHRHRHFKWAPKFSDIQQSIEAAPPGNDGWAIAQGFTRSVSIALVSMLCLIDIRSVTPLKANFMHTSDVALGELKL